MNKYITYLAVTFIGIAAFMAISRYGLGHKGAGDTGYYGKGTYTHPKKDYTKMYGKNNHEFFRLPQQKTQL